MQIEEITNRLKETSNWQDKYRQIMLMGKHLPEPQHNLVQPCNKVSGCESDVWISIDWSDGICQLSVWSNSKVVKGLLMIILATFDRKNHQQITETNIEKVFRDLGISQQLSQSRNNGINAISEAIKRA